MPAGCWCRGVAYQHPMLLLCRRFRKSESESKTTEQYEVRWKIDSDATGKRHGGQVWDISPCVHMQQPQAAVQG